MRNVASISSMSHSVTREWINRRTMIRSTANSIHELSTRGGLAQPLVTEGAGLVVGIADLDPSGLSPRVIQRALVSVPPVSYTRSHGARRNVGCCAHLGHWVAAFGVDWLPFLTLRPVAKCSALDVEEVFSQA